MSVSVSIYPPKTSSPGSYSFSWILSTAEYPGLVNVRGNQGGGGTGYTQKVLSWFDPISQILSTAEYLGLVNGWGTPKSPLLVLTLLLDPLHCWISWLGQWLRTTQMSSPGSYPQLLDPLLANGEVTHIDIQNVLSWFLPYSWILSTAEYPGLVNGWENPHRRWEEGGWGGGGLWIQIGTAMWKHRPLQ